MFPHERSLVKRFSGKPFVLLGVNCDRDRAVFKDVVERENLTWRSFYDGPDATNGSICRAWNIRGLPTLYVLDAEGTIRFQSVGSPGSDTIDSWIETLLAEIGETRANEQAAE